MVLFPQEILDFANIFVELQIKRHDADYDPFARLTKSAVKQDILRCERAIREFRNASLADRRAFAAWVLFKQPK